MDYDNLKEGHSVEQRTDRDVVEKTFVLLMKVGKIFYELAKRSKKFRITLEYDAESKKVNTSYKVISLRHDNQKEYKSNNGN